jgi:hypothetical protein
MAKRRTPKNIIALILSEALVGVRAVDRAAVEAKFDVKLDDKKWAKFEKARESFLKGVSKKVAKALEEKPAKVATAPAAVVA